MSKFDEVIKLIVDADLTGPDIRLLSDEERYAYMMKVQRVANEIFEVLATPEQRVEWKR